MACTSATMSDSTEPLSSTKQTVANDVLRDVMNRPDAQARQRYNMGTAQSISLDMESRGRPQQSFAFR